MKSASAIVGLCIACNARCAEQGAAASCPQETVMIPVEYQFKDADVRQEWIYRSLHASFSSGAVTFPARGVSFKDARAALSFCLSRDAVKQQMTLKVGPRSIVLEPRPIAIDSKGQSRMTMISLVEQPRPTWVIVKMMTRMSADPERLPVFEIELVNFGNVHVGGEVRYASQDVSSRCAFASPSSKVTVEVSLAGQRLKLRSDDPEYAEELIARDAVLERNVNQCAGNFRLSASLGKTGALAPGPTRIRYGFRQAKEGGKHINPELTKYFNGKFRFQVLGDDIWSADDAYR